mgnify:CR=1 FL=1
MSTVIISELQTVIDTYEKQILQRQTVILGFREIIINLNKIDEPEIRNEKLEELERENVKLKKANSESEIKYEKLEEEHRKLRNYSAENERDIYRMIQKETRMLRDD